MKIRERDEARTLRREQRQSIKEIARAVGVSRSSVSLWVRDIALTPDQIEALRQRNPALNGQMAGARIRSEKARAARLAAQREGRLYATREDPLHAAGCMLFWAEGSRHRNAVQFTNSDPAMHALFAAFVRTYFSPHRAAPRRVQPVRRSRRAAARHRGLLAAHGGAAAFVPHPVGGERLFAAQSAQATQRVALGTCRLTVHSTPIVQHIYGAIQEYGGFERPEWLD